MLEKVNEEEFQFLEDIQNPVALAEILFSDLDNLSAMDDETLSSIRKGQYPLLSFEYMLDDNPELTPKANFQLRQGAGDVYALGGRLFGKSLICLKVDMLVSMVLLGAEKCGFTSYDAIHIRGILEDVINALDRHPFLVLFEPQVTRSPSYRIVLRTGYNLTGINMNLTGKAPGSQFFMLHLTRLYADEASFETETIYEKRRDSVSEFGCIFRFAGMTNFTKYSPCGRAFYDYRNKGKIVNLPQYVNPTWDSNKKLNAIKDFSGEQSVNYRIFVKGEVVEDGESVFDMERVRKNYDENRQTKVFEVSKKDLTSFEHRIFVERPKNADECYVFADIGESAPTEIGIIFKINSKYRYVYNVTLYGLTDKEQFRVFRWLAQQLSANYISIDTTDGTGRAIYRSLGEVFPNNNLIAVAFNEKLAVDFDKDETTGAVKFKDGKPLYKEEYVSEWSIKHLKDLLYAERFDLPLDHKLDKQLNSVISMQSGTRTVYSCVSPEDHLFQSIPEYETVVCKVNGKLVVDSIKNIFSETSKVQVPSYFNGSLVWNSGNIIKESNKNNRIFNFHNTPGSLISVTEGHSMLIWDSITQNLKSILAKDVRVGDLLLTVDNFNFIREENKKLYSFNYTHKYKKNDLLELELNEDLAYFLGWACAEGFVGSDGCYVLCLNKEKDPVNELLALQRRIFKVDTGRIHNSDDGGCVLIVGGGRSVSNFITGMVGGGAHNKKVPADIFNSDNKIIESFLSGLLLGDGDKFGRLTTTSRSLASGFITLYKLLGFPCSLNSYVNSCNNREYYVKKGIRTNYFRNIPLEAFEVSYSESQGKTKNREKIESGFYNNKSFEKNKLIIPKVKDFNFVKVKDIDIDESYTSDVYDLSVDNNHNFVAGVGNLIVHNSFQVFSIAHWQTEFLLSKPVRSNKFCKSGI